MTSSPKKFADWGIIQWISQIQPLPENDPLYVHKSILRSLLTDVVRLRPGTRGLARDLITLEARLEHEGVSFLSVALCTLGKALDKGLSNGTFVCPVGLKRRPGSKNPLLFEGIFDDVFYPKSGDLRKDRDLTEDVKILRQLLYFLEEVRPVGKTSRKARIQGGSIFHEV